MAQQDGQQMVDKYGPYGLGMGDIDVYKPEMFPKFPKGRYKEYDDIMAEENGPNGARSTSNWSFKLGVAERISKVLINHGHIVDGIRFEIADERGSTRIEGFSGPGGSVSEIDLKPDEYITQLSGSCGNYVLGRGFCIASLYIHTNLRTQPCGPYGQKAYILGRAYFRVPVPLNGPIIGFYGSQGRFLESFGFYVRIMVDRYGLYGSQSLKNWSIMLTEGQRISKVMIMHGFIVDGIGFETSTIDRRPTTNWFGGRGGRHSEIALETYEFITQISGTYGNYNHNQGQVQIATLKIHTNIRPQGYGPYGLGRDVQGSVPFSTPVHLGGCLTGFFGQGETFLGSIGIHVTPHKLNYLNQTYGSQSSPNWSIKLASGEEFEKVMIRHGDIVDGIGFQLTNGNTNWFSGSGGTLSEITLQPGEYITQISGMHGSYDHGGHCIASIRIHTTLRQDGYGPYGKERQVKNLKPFRAPVPIDGCTVIGFSGAYKNHLDSIGVNIYPGEIIEKYGPYGFSGSSNWDIKIPCDERVQSIMIRHSLFVHGLGITLPSKIFNGRSPKNSNPYWFNQVSERLGTLSTIDLKSDEYITQISGMSASLLIGGAPAIASLRIHTNFKPEGYGPFGEGDQPLLQMGLGNMVYFSTPVPLGGPVAGFLGSTRGEFLRSIGLYAMVFSGNVPVFRDP